MYIAICDDSKEDRETLEKIITAYFSDNSLALALSCFPNGEAFLESIRENNPEVVFLDIYMGNKNGIEIARQIREKDQNCHIIFTTSSLDHAVQSYEVQAIHYLVKPLTIMNVGMALDRCKELFSFSHRYIELTSERVIQRILLRDIVFAEVFGNLTLVHTVTGDVKAYIPLNSLEHQLAGDEFFRCHRSYIINMNFIDSLQSSGFILTTGTTIPISRQDKQKIRQKYADFVFKGVRSRNA